MMDGRTYLKPGRCPCNKFMSSNHSDREVDEHISRKNRPWNWRSRLWTTTRRFFGGLGYSSCPQCQFLDPWRFGSICWMLTRGCEIQRHDESIFRLTWRWWSLSSRSTRLAMVISHLSGPQGWPWWLLSCRSTVLAMVISQLSVCRASHSDFSLVGSTGLAMVISHLSVDSVCADEKDVLDWLLVNTICSLIKVGKWILNTTIRRYGDTTCFRDMDVHVHEADSTACASFLIRSFR